MKFSQMLPALRQHIPTGMFEPQEIAAIRRAAIEFFRKTMAWQYDADAQAMVSGVREYDVEPLPGSDVVEVMAVSVGGIDLSAQTLSSIAAFDKNWRTSTGVPRWFMHLDVVQIVPTPISSGELNMLLALTPAANADGMPDALRCHEDAIVHGALRDLMMQPNQEWSNPQLGDWHGQQFSSAILAEKHRATTGGGKVVFRTKAQH